MLVRYWSTRGARVRRTPPCLKCPTCASVILSSLHFVVVEKKKKKKQNQRPDASLQLFCHCFPVDLFRGRFILNRYKLRPILETSRLLRTNFKRTRHPFFNAYFRWTSIAKSFTNFESLIIRKNCYMNWFIFFSLFSFIKIESYVSKWNFLTIF